MQVLGRVQRGDGAPHHRRVRHPADAIAVRAVRVEPALRHEVRDGPRGARGWRFKGDCEAVQPPHQGRHGVAIRRGQDEQVPGSDGVGARYVQGGSRFLPEDPAVRHDAGPLVGTRRGEVRGEADRGQVLVVIIYHRRDDEDGDRV